MTISTTHAYKLHSGNATTGPFTIDFQFFDASELVVTRISALGVETPLVITTDYTIAGGAGSTGSVTTVAVVAVGAFLRIDRATALTQTASWGVLQRFSETSLNRALDRQSLRLQEHNLRLARSLNISMADYIAGVSAALPGPTAFKLLRWNAGATAIENVDVTAAGTAITPYAATLLQASTAAAARAILLVPNNEFDLGAHYGGAGDNLTDNKGPIDLAVAAAIAAGGGVIRFGPGIWRINSNLTTIVANAAQSIVFEGAGPNLTTIMFRGTCTRGFLFQSTSTTITYRPTLMFRRMDIRSDNTDCGVAIEASWADILYSFSAFQMEDVWVLGLLTTDNFVCAVKLTNALHPRFIRAHLWGLTPAQSLKAVELLGNCTSPYFDSCLILAWGTAVHIEGETEGVFMIHGDTVVCKHGIRYIGTVLEPLITVHSSHFHCSLNCIWGTNISESMVVGNNFFCDGSQDSGSAWRAVRVDGANAKNWTVQSNTITTDAVGRAADTKTAISFETGSGHRTGGNVINGFPGFPLTNGILVAAGASAFIEDDPASMSDVTNPIAGAGTIRAPWRAFEVLSTDQVRMKNNTALLFRNFANSADIIGVSLNVNDILSIGQGAVAVGMATHLLPTTDNAFDCGIVGAGWRSVAIGTAFKLDQIGAALVVAGGNLVFPGTATNDNAAAGDVGQIIESSLPVGSAVSLTTNVAANITSISLTAGDWDVWGNEIFDPAATTVPVQCKASINTVSATHATAPNGGAYADIVAALATGFDVALTLAPKRLSLSVPTTVYLVGMSQFNTSTMAAYGYIGARRVR